MPKQADRRVTTKVSSSTRQRKVGCRWVFKQGPKKGLLCNRNCRGNYCFNHKPSKRIRDAKRYHSISRKQKIHEATSKLNNKIPIEKRITRESMKYRKLIDKAKILVKKFKNIKCLLDKNEEDPGFYTDAN